VADTSVCATHRCRWTGRPSCGEIMSVFFSLSISALALQKWPQQQERSSLEQWGSAMEFWGGGGIVLRELMHQRIFMLIVQ